MRYVRPIIKKRDQIYGKYEWNAYTLIFLWAYFLLSQRLRKKKNKWIFETMRLKLLLKIKTVDKGIPLSRGSEVSVLNLFWLKYSTDINRKKDTDGDNKGTT